MEPISVGRSSLGLQRGRAPSNHNQYHVHLGLMQTAGEVGVPVGDNGSVMPFLLPTSTHQVTVVFSRY